MNSEANSRHENKEGLLQTTSFLYQGAPEGHRCSHRYIWMLTQIAVQLGRKQVSGQHQANAHEHILTRPQTSATAAPQQINTTTTQVQDVHDKKARGPSRETQKQRLLREA